MTDLVVTASYVAGTRIGDAWITVVACRAPRLINDGDDDSTSAAAAAAEEAAEAEHDDDGDDDDNARIVSRRFFLAIEEASTSQRRRHTSTAAFTATHVVRSPWIEMRCVVHTAASPSEATAAVDDSQWQQLPRARIVAVLRYWRQVRATTFPSVAVLVRGASMSLRRSRESLRALLSPLTRDVVGTLRSSAHFYRTMLRSSAALSDSATRLYKIMRPLDTTDDQLLLMPFYSADVVRSLAPREVAAVLSVARAAPFDVCFADLALGAVCEPWKAAALAWSLASYETTFRAVWPSHAMSAELHATPQHALRYLVGGPPVSPWPVSMSYAHGTQRDSPWSTAQMLRVVWRDAPDTVGAHKRAAFLRLAAVEARRAASLFWETCRRLSTLTHGASRFAVADVRDALGIAPHRSVAVAAADAAAAETPTVEDVHRRMTSSAGIALAFMRPAHELLAWSTLGNRTHVVPAHIDALERRFVAFVTARRASMHFVAVTGIAPVGVAVTARTVWMLPTSVARPVPTAPSMTPAELVAWARERERRPYDLCIADAHQLTLADWLAYVAPLTPLSVTAYGDVDGPRATPFQALYRWSGSTAVNVTPTYAPPPTTPPRVVAQLVASGAVVSPEVFNLRAWLRREPTTAPVALRVSPPHATIDGASNSDTYVMCSTRRQQKALTPTAASAAPPTRVRAGDIVVDTTSGVVGRVAVVRRNMDDAEVAGDIFDTADDEYTWTIEGDVRPHTDCCGNAVRRRGGRHRVVRCAVWCTRDTLALPARRRVIMHVGDSTTDRDIAFAVRHATEECVFVCADTAALIVAARRRGDVPDCDLYDKLCNAV
jgi:hypothetical protein